jgi:hypothetical protein
VSSALGASLFWPGLGQVLQGRFVAATFFTAGIVGFALWGFAVASVRGPVWLGAAVLALWSVIDAYRWARRAASTREVGRAAS